MTMGMRENQYFIFDRPHRNALQYAFKTARDFLGAAWFQLRLNLAHPRVEEKKYRVSVCAIFKNEAVYLKEWIEFHRIVGVEHFYLYNNNSDDGFSEVIAPYLREGLVTLVDWPHQQKQMEAYMDCIARFSSETKWIGFIDIDEFVVPKSTDTIYDFLRPFEKNRGAVRIYWRLYGSSGLTGRSTEGLVTEDFTVCWPKYDDVGKCFYNTAFGFDPHSARHHVTLHHFFWANYKGKDVPPVNIFNKVCLGDRNVATSADFPIQINHYFTKSYAEYVAKCAKGDVYFTINPHDEEYFYRHEMKCTAVDYAAYKYLVKLKLAMERAANE